MVARAWRVYTRRTGGHHKKMQASAQAHQQFILPALAPDEQDERLTQPTDVEQHWPASAHIPNEPTDRVEISRLRNWGIDFQERGGYARRTRFAGQKLTLFSLGGSKQRQ